MKYSGSDVRVEVETPKEEGKYAAVRVKDHGPGIPRPELKRIFKRFYRMHGPAGHARERHRPRLVHRALGGAGMAAKPGPKAPVRARAARLCCSFPLRLAMNRVLVVEDEQHLAEGLRFNLEAEGYEVDVVDNGEAALDLLIGAATPGVRHRRAGRHAPRQETASTWWPRCARPGQFIPTLILTARGHSDDVLEGFASGADDYLAKPFELDILIARISGLCGAATGCVPTPRRPPPSKNSRPIRFPSATKRCFSTCSNCTYAIRSSR